MVSPKCNCFLLVIFHSINTSITQGFGGNDDSKLPDYDYGAHSNRTYAYYRPPTDNRYYETQPVMKGNEESAYGGYPVSTHSKPAFSSYDTGYPTRTINRKPSKRRENITSSNSNPRVKFRFSDFNNTLNGNDLYSFIDPREIGLNNAANNLNSEKNGKSDSVYILPVSAFIVCALFAGIIITVLVLLVWRCYVKRMKKKVTSGTMQLTDPSTRTQRSSTSSVYETIPEHGFTTNPTINLPKTIDMSQRPLPLPVPTDVLSPPNPENPYLQYDTVYEHRVFRLGRDGPVIHFSERPVPIVAANQK